MSLAKNVFVSHPLVVMLAAAAVLAGCRDKPRFDASVKAASSSSAQPLPVAPSPAAAKEALADPARGKELVLSFQCNRCHDGTGHPPAPDGKHCVHCHTNIMDDKFAAPRASLVRWKPRVKELADAPSLEAIGKRFTRTWVTSYLLQPSHLRPHLHAYMPRLPLTPAEARDVAAYLVPESEPPSPSAVSPEFAGADLGKGRQLLETKGCGSCHVFTGVVALPSSAPPPMDGKEFERGYKLAPDLRFARERMTIANLMAWLENPKAIKSDTPMPAIALTKAEVRDLAAYILTVELGSPPGKPAFARLPVLERKVTFAEVDQKVFHRTCWHCHSEPDYAIGDGGPGNSGGFGFKPRGLNLSDYSGIAAGYVDDKGERASIFAKDNEGVPRLVRALLARHEEENSGATGPVRGMPLGYAPLSAEDIQLVESWVAQGRPR
ncbi:MAG TPA: cytochrome c [Labilithrix sp.]|nr:cytochrome c [Labilithrix sp.]